uniref:Uncharacterized protein n=1 Tax=Knipowitschia caucasica TaxID=637954 RepID=A0AAV2K2R4_KNICA
MMKVMLIMGCLLCLSLASTGQEKANSDSLERDTAHQRVARSGSDSTSNSGESTTRAATTRAASTTAAAGAALSAAQIQQLIQALTAALG